MIKPLPYIRYVLKGFLIIVFNTVLFAFQAKAGDDDSITPTKSIIAQSRWVLIRTQHDGFLLHPGNERKFLVSFQDSTVKLESFCNNLTANFSSNGGCNISFKGIYTTQRKCTRPTMFEESEYRDILKRVTSFDYDQTTRRLRFFIDKELVMILQRTDKLSLAELLAGSE